jgi:hypothetical protein
MFGWQELSNYHPLLALIGGIAAFFCFTGVGRLGFMLMRAMGEGPLQRPLELILGVLAVSVAVQALAMAGLMSVGAAQGIAALLVVPGLLVATADVRSLSRLLTLNRPSAASVGWWAPAAVIAASLLAAAIAPESRADETAYHALVPSRVLVDGSLRVYPLPWEATIWPQLLWHYSLVPIFATAGSAGARVLSFCVAILLASTVADVVRSRLQSEGLAALAWVAVLAGGYPIALFTTLGPHAFGYLATFVACHAVATPITVRGPVSPTKVAFGIAVACAGMIAGKLTMLPLAAVVMAIAARDLTPAGATRWDRAKILGTLAVPSVVAFAPIVIWGWSAARSPIGAMTAELFHSPAFGAEALRVYHGTREVFADAFLWRIELSYWSLLLAVGVVASLVVTPGATRSRYILLFGCQVVVILLLLPKEIRHLGGLQYVLFVGGFCASVSRLRLRRVADSRIAFAGALAVLPWAALGLFVSSVNMPLVAGFETPPDFLRRYSGLFEDYERLDRILPANAEIAIGHSATSPTQYAWFARPPVFYAPRPVLATDRDLDRRAPVYLLYIGQGEPDQTRNGAIIGFDPVLPPGFVVGKNVYSNSYALFYPSRTPLASTGRRARIDVFELRDSRSPAERHPVVPSLRSE